MPTGEGVAGIPSEYVLLEILKIDSAPVDGLLGVEDSLSYIAHEIERHFHGFERWFGAAIVPDGESHVANRIGTGVAAFQADAGNNAWGAWLQILGSTDTPASAGNVKFDLHRVQVVGVERTNTVHFVQIAYGASGGAALAAAAYTEFVFHPLGQQGQRVPIPVMCHRHDVGTKVWLRILVPGQNTGTMDFYHGLHEYEG